MAIDSSVIPLSCRVLAPEGGAGGTPVLLLHTFASNGAADWPEAGLPGALLARGRPVYVPDLPGHGANPRPDSAATGRQVEALSALISGMPGGDVDIVGYSLGARLAWALALECPRPVRHLVLGGLSPVEPFGALDMGALRAFAGGGAVPEDPLTALIGQMITAPGCDAGSLLPIIEGLRADPFRPREKAPQVPTLFVKGEEDPVASGIEELVGLVDGAGLETVPGDHAGALHGTAFREAVLAFLDR